mmetsp:Transcript_21241/g.49456  ORF Transcript_21241/g.49456 Transcript_21241/m.49456 type:complete len:226 (-) Transcript_21241:38-715(-)
MKLGHAEAQAGLHVSELPFKRLCELRRTPSFRLPLTHAHGGFLGDTSQRDTQLLLHTVKFCAKGHHIATQIPQPNVFFPQRIQLAAEPSELACEHVSLLVDPLPDHLQILSQACHLALSLVPLLVQLCAQLHDLLHDSTKDLAIFAAVLAALAVCETCLRRAVPTSCVQHERRSSGGGPPPGRYRWRLRTFVVGERFSGAGQIGQRSVKNLLLLLPLRAEHAEGA